MCVHVCVQEKERELVLKSIVTGGKSVCVCECVGDPQKSSMKGI